MGIVRDVLIGVAITGIAGFLITFFREPLLKGAQQLGETVAGVATRPFTAGIETLSTAFKDLPDIQFRLPGIKLTGGLFTFEQEEAEPEPGEIIPGTDELEPGLLDGGVTLGKGCKVNPDGTIECPTPPTFEADPGMIPMAEAVGLTPRQGALPIEIGGQIERRSIADIIAISPEAVGLFDILGTQKVEFLPLGVPAVEFFQEAGQRLRLSGQLFEEIRGIGQVG